MDSQNMQVIGLCRFSYPAIGGFQVEHDTIEDRIDYLYAPHRMEERFRTFEAFTLPPMRAQTDPNFTFLVVIGGQMPPIYEDRLRALLNDVPHAILQKHPPKPHRLVMRDAVNSVRQDTGLPCLQFRMDDDDAVACMYVERLRAAAQDLRPLLRKNRHIAIDFNQGFIARPGAGGIKATPTIENLWTAGLAISAKPAAKNCIMNFGHSKLARFMPVVSFTGEDMFVRGHNDHNDSRQKRGVKPVTLLPLNAEGKSHFHKTFAIDADHVASLFS